MPQKVSNQNVMSHKVLGQKVMNRKVIRLSTSTSVVSLPTSWLKKNNVKKGDDLFLEEKDNLIVISKGINESKKQIFFSIKDVNDKLVWMIIDAIYMTGYNEISIETKNQTQRDNFVKIVQLFPGLIIYDEKKDIIKLKNIAIQEDFDLQQLMSRIRNLTISIIDDSLNSIKTKNWEVLSNIKKRDYLINTYVSMAFRNINLYGYVPSSAQGIISEHIKFLEIFSDRLCSLLKKIGEQKETSKHIQEIILDIRNLYREEAVLFVKFNLVKLSEFDNKRQELIKKTKKLEKEYQIEINELISMFFDIEETLTQLNISKIDCGEEKR